MQRRRAHSRVGLTAIPSPPASPAWQAVYVPLDITLNDPTAPTPTAGAADRLTSVLRPVASTSKARGPPPPPPPPPPPHTHTHAVRKAARLREGLAFPPVLQSLP